jgi:predicted MFS family arabinose efflux permease
MRSNSFPYSTSSNFLLWNTFLVVLGTMMVNPFLVVELSNASNLSPSILSFVFMLAMLAGSFFAWLITARSSQIELSRLMTFGLLALAIGLIGITLVLSLSSALALVAAGFGFLLYRFGNAVSLTVTRTLHVQTNIGAKSTAPLFARVAAVFSLAATIGPLMGGGLLHVGGFELLLWAATLIFIAAMALSIRMGKFAEKELTHENGKNSSSSLEISAFSGILACTIFYALSSQTFGFIPLKLATDAAPGWVSYFYSLKSIIAFVFSIYVVRLFKNVGISHFGKLILSISFIGIALVLLSVLHSDGVFLVGIVFVYAVSEVIFQTYALDWLKSIVDVNAIAKAIAFFSFLTASVGPAIGQYYGVVLYETASVGIWVGGFLAPTVIAVFLFYWSQRMRKSSTFSR